MNNGFSYTLPREKIIEYMKLSAEEKLTWLEEILHFTIACQNENTRRVREYFRNSSEK